MTFVVMDDFNLLFLFNWRPITLWKLDYNVIHSPCYTEILALEHLKRFKGILIRFLFFFSALTCKEIFDRNV